MNKGRHFIHILLLVALLYGAAAQTLACVTLMEFDSHACCRMLAAGALAKMRAVPSSHQEPAGSMPCCEASPANSQPSLLTHRDCLQDNSATHSQPVAAAPPVRSEGFSHLRLRAPSGYSPPPFILHHSLLI